MGEDPTVVEERQVQVLARPARVHVGGEGGKTLLLLHGGWGGAALHWSRVWDRLAQRYQVVAPELPGLGDPSQPGLASITDYVSWLSALLDALEVRQTYCIGSSFGASLAWSFAGRRPERCQGLVMVNGVPMPRTPGPLRWLGGRPLGRGLMRVLARQLSFTPRFLPRAFADPNRIPPDLRARLRQTPPAQVETFLDCLIAGDGPPRPRAPMLVLWGEADRLPGSWLRQGRRLATSSRGAQFASLPMAGHFPQLERPEAFVEVLESFLERRPQVVSTVSEIPGQGFAPQY